MQIYPINNINNNPKFGTLKGLRYVGEFNPSTNLEHAKIVKAVLDSKAIKRFGEKYDFLAQFEYNFLFSPITMTRYAFPYYFSVKLIPERLTLWERIFGKKKSEAEVKAPVEETPKEEEKIENLPTEFTLENVLEDSEYNAVNKIIKLLKITTLSNIESSLQWATKYQNGEQ